MSASATGSKTEDTSETAAASDASREEWAKKRKSSSFLKYIQTIEYPHGCFSSSCITSCSDTVFSGSRRHVKAFKNQNDTWTESATITPPDWQDGDMRDIGGASAMAVFERKRYLLVENDMGNVYIGRRLARRIEELRAL